MRPARNLLEKHGRKLLLAFGLFLLGSGLVGQLRGRDRILLADHNRQAQVRYEPAWLLYGCGLLVLVPALFFRPARQKPRHQK